jgi:hypothetical protein
MCPNGSCSLASEVASWGTNREAIHKYLDRHILLFLTCLVMFFAPKPVESPITFSCLLEQLVEDEAQNILR